MPKNDGKPTKAQAIKILNKRIDWLTIKAKERRDQGLPAHMYQLEIDASEMAIVALKTERDFNIATNGGFKEVG